MGGLPIQKLEANRAIHPRCHQGDQMNPEPPIRRGPSGRDQASLLNLLRRLAPGVQRLRASGFK